MTAGAITLLVAGFYAERALRDYVASRHGPAPVPETVQQQSAGVSYSFSNQDGTTFTIRASHATQFKEGDRADLQDVWVTIYGKKGDRNDNIHTRECSYEPAAGNIQCSGDVEIDIQAAAAEPGKAAGQPLHVTTSNLTFNRQTGEASTPAPVKLTFPGGQGHGTGLNYSGQQSMLRVNRDVAFEVAPSDKTGGLPVSATAANLEFHRDERTIALGGPVMMHQGDRQLAAESVSIALDAQYHAKEVTAQGNPVLSGKKNGAEFAVSAQKFDGTLDPGGAIQQLTADGGVNGIRKSRAGEDHFSAGHVEFAMVPGRNLMKEMTATGGVLAESHAGGDGGNARTLRTDALKIDFAAPPAGAKGDSSLLDRQQIESAETLGPATIESVASGETVKAAKFAAQFGADGRLQKLLGHSGVEITRKPASGDAQTSNASELVATFGTGDDWATLDETGKVRLTEDGKTATAAHAQVLRESDTITLDGSPEFSDGASRTSAGSVVINQKTGDIRATGSVVSTEMAQSKANDKSGGISTTPDGMGNIALGEGDAHISADALTGSTTSGDVVFRGHARLWQGQAVLDADQIAVSRNAGTLQATGSVVAVFPQEAGQGPQLPAVPASKKNAPTAAGPVVWQVRAQRLTYTNTQSMAHLDGGVTASSEQGSLHSQTLDVYLAPDAGAGTTNAGSAFGGRGLERVVAQGAVVVSQNGVHGYAEQAEYDAARGKFVFSGGEPRITDGNGNTTTGRSLTFDVASDTISVDSDEGSRTLTRHRVEK
jgi:LPS export ABC transporter protein LptC